MIGTLIESRRQRQRRTGGSLASIMVHSALIAGAVVATTHNGTGVSRPPFKVPVARPLFIPSPPPPSPVAQRPVSASVMAAPAIPVIRVPALIPKEIPPIDLSIPPTPTDFGERRSHGRGMFCESPCPQVGLGTDGSGEAPVWAVNDVMMQLREAPVPPRYPDRLRQAGVEGSVIVKFVVDTLGRVDMASVEVLKSTHALFTDAVRDALGKMRFTPATAGTRRVAALAMMPFQFTLKK